MRHSDPYDGETSSRLRSRTATVIGILFLIGTLLALIWFGVDNTDTREPPRVIGTMLLLVALPRPPRARGLGSG